MRTKHSLVPFLASLLLLSTVQANASVQLDDRLKALVGQCANCHGENGIATLANAANLAGQNPIYTEIQLKNFRDGKRQDPVMAIAVQGLSNEDIALLANYYAQLSADN